MLPLLFFELCPIVRVKWFHSFFTLCQGQNSFLPPTLIFSFFSTLFINTFGGNLHHVDMENCLRRQRKKTFLLRGTSREVNVPARTP